MKTNKQLWYALLSSESAFWLSVATKIKVITTANQKRGKYVKEPTKTQNKNNLTAKSAGKRGRPIRGLVSHLIGWESGASFLHQSQSDFE